MSGKRWKWALSALCVVLLVFAAAWGCSRRARERLDAGGVETRAVLAESFSRTEYKPYGPRGRLRKKETVHYFRYAFRVDGADFGGTVRKKGRLVAARAGDSVTVCYLPANPSVHRLQRDSAGEYRLKRRTTGSRPYRR